MIANLPFAALRTFEAVVRLRGFMRAAEELGVTQSAVSQQVHALEDWIGCKLVIRGPGGATPTGDGQRVAAAVEQGFGVIAATCQDIRGKATPNLSIRVKCLPGFAFLWLLPRLINFDRRFPEYQVSVIASPDQADPGAEDADISITYGDGRHPGFHVEPLMSERIFPVCAPSLLRLSPLANPDDLHNHVLLVDDIEETGGTLPDLAFWAASLGLSQPAPQRETRFGQSYMVVQAACHGLGVAIGREPLVIDALADGRLVRPFPELVTSDYRYWMVCAKGNRSSKRVEAVRAWLTEEVAKQPDITPDSLAQGAG